MKTEDWIAMLATGAGAVDPRPARRRIATAVSAGLAGAVLLTLWFLGLNPKLGAYLLLPMHWFKVVFTVSLAAAALAATTRLARPGMRLKWIPIVLATPLGVAWWLAAAALLGAEPSQRLGLLLGQTWTSCPLIIAALALPAFVLALWALDAMAPTALRAAGAAAGLLAGAIGAAAYTLHCPELAAPFIAVWYVLGMLIPGAVGAVIGPRVLSW